jgi:hypothetical protein
VHHGKVDYCRLHCAHEFRAVSVAAIFHVISFALLFGKAFIFGIPLSGSISLACAFPLVPGRYLHDLACSWGEGGGPLAETD